MTTVRTLLLQLSPKSTSVTTQTSRSGLGIWVLVCLGAFVVLAPSIHLFPAESLYDGKRLMQLLVLGGVYVWLLAYPPAQRAWLSVYRQSRWQSRWGTTFIVLLGLLSAFFAPVPRYALLEVFYFVLLFGVIVLVAALYQAQPALADRVVIGLVLTSVGLYTLRFVVGYTAYLVTDIGMWPAGGTGFDHIRFFNQFQTWTLPLLVIPLVMTGSGKLVRVLSASLATIWWSLLIASGGRGTTLAVVCAIVCVVLVFRKCAWPYVRAQGLTLAGGIVCYLVLFVVLGQTESALTQRALTTDSERFLLWNDAVEMIEQAPWLGVGPMQYAYYHPSDLNAHPHNLALQIAAEWGVPAAILLGSLILWGLGAWIRHSLRHAHSVLRQHQKIGIHVAITAALLAGCGHALLSGMHIMPVPQMMAVLIVGWAWGLYYKHRSNMRRPSAMQHRLLVVVFSVAVAVVAWITVPEVGHEAQQERFEVYEELPERSVRNPRFWQIGYIW